MRRALLAVLLLAGFVAAWQGVASLARGRRPHPGLARSRPGGRSRDDGSLLLDNAWVTLVEVVLGLAMAVVRRRGASPSACT